jgi:outer membrane protein assembly factor BamB
MRLALLVAAALVPDTSGRSSAEDVLFLCHGSDGKMRVERVVPASGRVRWRLECGGPKFVRYWVHTLVQADAKRGRVYLADHPGQAAMAVDLHSGRVAWRTEVGDLSSHPFVSVAGDRVLVSGQNFASSVCLDARTGAVAWRLAKGGTHVAAGGRFFVACPGVTALDPATGTEGWTSAHSWAIALRGGQVLAANWNGGATCADAATGREAWTTTRGLLYVAETGGTIVAPLYHGDTTVGLDAATGREKWAVTLSKRDHWAVQARGDTAVVWAQGSGAVHVLDAARGTERYALDVGQGHNEGARLVALGERRVCTVAGTTLTCLESGARRVVWRAELDAPGAGVAIASGVVIAVTAKGSRGYGLESGRLLWRGPTASDRGVHVVELGGR